MKVLILVLAAVAVSAQSGDPGVTLERAIRKETVEGDLKGAIDLYKKVVAGAAKNRGAAAKALLRLGECYEKQGDAEARKAYERLVKEFADQKDQARDAQVRLAALGPAPGGGKAMVAQMIAKSNNLGLSGRVTPDGRLVPFIDRETGDVAVRDVRTGAIRRFTNEGPRAQRGENPIPSRDGKQIAFRWARELRVINIDGSGMRTVPIKGIVFSYGRPLDWSLDGKSVLVEGWEGAQYILAAIDLASGEVKRLRCDVLADMISGDIDIAGFSPDSRWIVYSRRLRAQDSDWDIFALHTETGRETAVVTGAGMDRKPVWVPDSDKIVFRSDRNGKNAIWMVRFQDGHAAGAPILVKPDAGDYDPKGISRDGSLFYGLWHESTDVYQAIVDPRTLRVQGAPARQVETHVGRNSSPIWSPDGRSFAYYSGRDPGETFRLVVHHPDGKETVMAEPFRWDYSPHWCGSGDRVTSWGKPWWPKFQIFDARTGEPSLLDFSVLEMGPPHGGVPALSPDCKSAYYSAYYTKQRRISKFDPATGKMSDLLTDSGGMAGNPRVSPDGQWLALQGELAGGKESGILLLPTAGGPLRMLAPGGWGHGWTPDSKRLMYIRRVARPDGQGTEVKMYWAPVEGGEPQAMGIQMPGAAAPSLNPDGKRLLFSAAESSNELWVLRNLPLN